MDTTNKKGAANHGTLPRTLRDQLTTIPCDNCQCDPISTFGIYLDPHHKAYREFVKVLKADRDGIDPCLLAHAVMSCYPELSHLAADYLLRRAKAWALTPEGKQALIDRGIK